MQRVGRDIVKIARQYNGGSGCMHGTGLFGNGHRNQGDHPGKTVRASNTAIQFKLIKSDYATSSGMIYALSGIVVAWFIYKM